MPLVKAPPRATKRQRQAVVSQNMHILSMEGGRPQDQMIAMALQQAGLNKKGRKRERKSKAAAAR